MAFKKNKIGNKSPFITNIIGIISLILVFLLGMYLIKNINIFSFKVTNEDKQKNQTIVNDDGVIIKKSTFSKDQIESIKEIDKKRNKKINILVLGRGGGNHDAPDLTDTIILASIDSEKKSISMLSIPRDLYVEYPTGSRDGKINGLYAKFKHESGSKETGVKILKKKIIQITGEEIDYYVNVDFKGFIEIIDTIGGINIEIPKNFIDNKYPDGKWGYKRLIFKKGNWVFDGENALKYSRSRHSTSDFDRSIRQQQVIKSIKEKLTGSYFLTSPGKIKELYGVFTKNVDTDLKLSTIVKLAYKLNSNSDFKIISSNLNDSCFYGSSTCLKGGFLYTPNRSYFGGMSVILVEGADSYKLNNYSPIKKYTNILFNYPEVLDENVKINIFNSLKVNNLAGKLSNDIIKYGFNIPKVDSIGNTKEVHAKSIIYYNGIDKNSITLRVLKSFFSGKIIKTEYPIFSNSNANIEIIIGEDYRSKNNPFKF